jgi:beta-lactamase superfamily II metal-dependent hydrolase
MPATCPYRINRSAIFLFAAILFASAYAQAQAVGDVLPPWTPGGLDIHQISTGRGNAALLILPDGTTLMVDAGAQAGSNPRWVTPRPDDSRTPGEWIARYVRQMLRHDPSPRIDYMFITHFHSDHMGQVTDTMKMSKSGQYRLSGVTELAEQFPMGKILDRGYPDYQFPALLEDSMVKNLKAFIKWQAENKGAKAERFQPGRNDQIVLLRNPKQYPNFEVRNLMANGEVWTGNGTATRQVFPDLKNVAKEDWPSENMCSAGIRLSYGKFDFYTGGDIPGIPFEGFPMWHDVETPVAQAVGPVDVAMMNHHGYIDSQNAYFVGTLRPRVWMFNVWESAHPTARVYSRLQSTRVYPGPRDIFSTHMHESNRNVVVGLDKLASDHGHIVIRLAPGRDTFRIFILDDSAETFKIKSIHGPYESR